MNVQMGNMIPEYSSNLLIYWSAYAYPEPNDFNKHLSLLKLP